MTTPTQNNIPSSTAIDVRFNAEKLDEVVNSDNETYQDRFGNERFTLKGIVAAIQNFFTDLGAVTGFSKIGQVESFDKLRTIPVSKEGQSILLAGYYAGSYSGGGEFVGHLGTAADDGGHIAAGSGYYWERVYNKDYVDPVDFGAKRTTVQSDFDSGPAIRNAIKTAVRLGLSNVQFVGDYLVTSLDPVGWVLPFDDGTLSPSRSGLISSGKDSVLSSEPQIKMPIHISLPYGINLVSKDILSNSITFSWDKQTVNTQQAVAIVGRVKNWDGTYVASLSGKNRMYGGVTRNNFDGFTIRSAFIGYVSDGISQFFDWGRIAFEQCGFCALFQGVDLSKIEYAAIKSSYCGIVSGGWWLQRNGGTYPGTALPPYPSSGGDIQSLGWTDFLSIKELFFAPPLGKWEAGSIWEQIDTFFDTYFFKSANTVKTADGGTGRLSSTLHDLTSDAYAAYSGLYYRGVASRGFCDIKRHPRNNQGNEILRIKVYGSHRIPILVPDGGDKVAYGQIQYAYVERTPYYNTSTTATTTTDAQGNAVSNDFYTLPQNKWNTSYPYASVNAPVFTQTPALVVQGIMGVTKSSPVNSIVARGSSDGVTGLNGRLTQYAVSTNTADFNTQPSVDFMIANAAGVGTVALRCYNNRQYSRPLTFTSSGGTLPTGEKPFSALAYSGEKYVDSGLVLSNGATDGTNTFAPKSFLLNTEEERSKITINVLLEIPNNTSTYTNDLLFPLKAFPDPLQTILTLHVGPYGPIFNLYRFKPSATNAGIVPVACQIVKGTDNKFYLKFANGYWPSTATFLKGSDLEPNSYFGFSVTYTKTSYVA